MRVELGNAQPHEVGQPDREVPGPAVLYVTLPDDLTLAPGADIRDLALHLAQNPGPVTHLPDHEMFVTIVNGSEGVWRPGHHGAGLPTWVHVESTLGTPDDIAKAAELQRLLSEFWSIPERPADIEMTHHTLAGPPGVGPAPALEVVPELEGEIPPGTTADDAPRIGPNGEVLP